MSNSPTQEQVYECLEALRVSVEIAVNGLVKKGYTRAEALHIFSVWGKTLLIDMTMEASHE